MASVGKQFHLLKKNWKRFSMQLSQYDFNFFEKKFQEQNFRKKI